jgi:hypothetical protein
VTLRNPADFCEDQARRRGAACAGIWFPTSLALVCDNARLQGAVARAAIDARETR